MSATGLRAMLGVQWRTHRRATLIWMLALVAMMVSTAGSIAGLYPTPEKIHAIIDRHRTAALPFAGSSLLAEHYHDVPLLSIAWGVGQIGLPFSESGAITVLGLSLPLQDDSTIIASITPGLPLASSVHLRVEEIAPD
jgi:hypothetical protein